MNDFTLFKFEKGVARVFTHRGDLYEVLTLLFAQHALYHHPVVALQLLRLQRKKLGKVLKKASFTPNVPHLASQYNSIDAASVALCSDAVHDAFCVTQCPTP